MSFFAELKRRNVFRVAGAYVVAAWVLLQAADLFFDSIGAPNWVMQTLLFAFLIGFVVAVVIAWAFEVTPDGIKRDRDVNRDTSITHQTAKRLDIVTIGLLVVAIALLIANRLQQGSGDTSTQDPSVQSSAQETQRDETGTDNDPPIVAVLPFKAAGSEDGGFLAGGLHDDLLTRLAKLDAFKVISRTSMMEYANTTKNMRQIGSELGARYILEGGIQALGKRVRVNAQLIDAPTDEHIWADTYNRELTAEHLFDIQADLALAIASELKTALSESDRAVIADIPTQDMEAYNAYLRGLGLREAGGHNVRVVLEVMAAFENAVSADPNFAQAWAQLAIERSRYSQTVLTKSSKEAALRAKNRAHQLQPNLYEVELAKVVYLYRVEFEYQRALEALEALEANHTLNASSMMLKAFLLRRLGRFNEAYLVAKQAQRLDPRSIQTAQQLVSMAWENDDCVASKEYRRAGLSLAPDNVGMRVSVAHSLLECDGDARRANELLRGLDFDGAFQYVWASLTAAAARDFTRLMEISKLPPPAGAPLISRTMRRLDTVQALRNLDREQDANDELNVIARELASFDLNEASNSSPLFAMAKSRYHSSNGHVEKTREWVTETKQRWERTSKGDRAGDVGRHIFYALILAEVGLYSEAIDELRITLESPGGDRFPLIDSLPTFDVLKDEPGYQELLERYSSFSE